MVFHMKIIMDEIFGPENYRNCITRKKCNPKNYTRKKFGNISDYILFYTKSENYVWNRPVEPWTEERAKEYQYVEPETGRRYMKVPLHAPAFDMERPAKPGEECCRHPASIGNSLRVNLMSLMPVARFSGPQTAIPGERSISTIAKASESKISGWTLGRPQPKHLHHRLSDGKEPGPL